MPAKQKSEVYLNRIQSSLRKKKDNNGKAFKTVPYAKIREVIATKFSHFNPDNMSLKERTQIVDFIHQRRLKKREEITSKPTVSTAPAPVLQEQKFQVEERDTNHTNNETQPTAAIAVTEKQEIATTQNTELSVQETSISAEMLAPQEAVALIQEIASDSTSRYKQMAAELLEQLDSRTDSIVKIIEATPEIESEMLRRKLKTATRKSVDYDSIVTKHFRQSSDEIKEYLSDIASEYNITI